MTLRRKVVGAAAQRVAPSVASGAVRQLADRAVDGVSRFPGAREVARRHLARTGDVDQAVNQVLEQHVRLAGAQGFVTNLGGLVTLPLALPANLTGLGLIQMRMAAAIAHLRGYELDRPNVRVACLLTLLGDEDVEQLIGEGKLAARPGSIAVMPAASPQLLSNAYSLVGTALVTQLTGKRLTLTVTRRVPLLGGGVGAVADGVSTYQVGRYADRQFPRRTTVEQV